MASRADTSPFDLRIEEPNKKPMQQWKLRRAEKIYMAPLRRLPI